MDLRVTSYDDERCPELNYGFCPAAGFGNTRISLKVSAINFLLNNTVIMSVYSSIIFFIVPILVSTFSPEVHKLLYARRKQMFWLRDTSRMRRFFHFLVTGEMAASESVFE
jgi:ABC-type polysaccharide transport system permease subunit